MSELKDIIPPEIQDDEFAFLLTKLVAEEALESVLEIGASSGAGSTEAIYQGVLRNQRRVDVYSIEVSATRFAALQERYSKEPRMHSFNVSSVSLNEFPTDDEVGAFYHAKKTNLNQYPLEMVLQWLKQDRDYIQENTVLENGIEFIKKSTGIKCFDLVLIDGSEFTGVAELKQVYGAKFLLLDDICAFKNHQNHAQLQSDPAYELIAANTELRNGYSCFKRKDITLLGENYEESIKMFRLKKSPQKKGRLQKFLAKLHLKP